MQGSVCGSLMCTTSMDKLGQEVYENENLIYWYKGIVAVPPLCMVDDILAVQSCSQKSVELNAKINAFIELKKLSFSQSKCSKIHIGKENAVCPQLKVHEQTMKDSHQEKYLGDLVHTSGKIKATIEQRAAKGWGIVSDILAILNEIPLGIYRLDMGLKLRQAKLLNGMLFSSEGWQGLGKDDLKCLEKVDEALLRALLQCHPKTPLEFLYLETGSVKISDIVSSRRLNYLQTLLARDEEELTNRVIRGQEIQPTPGDYILLVKDDCAKIEMDYDEHFILSSGSEYKLYIKKKIRIAAFKELQAQQQEHSKVKRIKYDKFEAQSYMFSPLFSNDDVALIAALRSHTVRGVRCNFRNMYKPNIYCPLKCWAPGTPPVEDTQQHMLECTKLTLVQNNTVANKQIVYDDIYGDVAQQKAVVSIFKQLLQQRNEILENET